MKLREFLMAVAASLSITGPALAGDGADTLNVERDYALSNGAGTSGPGMSGYLHQGMSNHAVQTTSVHRGRRGLYRVSDGFSRGADYNNTNDISLQHIR